MAHTYINADGALVVDAGTVQLESTSTAGEVPAQPDHEGEVVTDVDGDATGE